jgi:glycosyltransferase involved in cell wall biosynthesis
LPPKIDKDRDKKYFLYVGRFTAEKGVDSVIEAFLQSEAIKCGYQLKLCGGSYEDLIQLHPEFSVNDTAIHKYVQFIDFANSDIVQSQLSEATALLFFPRWVENLPNTVLEAYACGTPVISSKFGSMEYSVRHEYSGLLCEQTIAARSSAISRLVQEPSLRDQLSLGAREMNREYSREEHMKSLILLFEKIQQQSK